MHANTNLFGKMCMSAWCRWICAQAEKLAETKGLNFVDREKAKHHAKKEAEQMYDNSDYARDDY